MKNLWEKEFEEEFIALKDYFNEHSGATWDYWKGRIMECIRFRISQTRQETIEKIKELIVAEINIARTEGDKTSRLTSLFMRITDI